MDSSKKEKEKKNLHEGHRKRMRERFRKTGFDGFTEHQILELILFYSNPRRDTNEIAHELINAFGSISGVLDADYTDLAAIKNVTENTATLLKIIPNFMPVYYSSRQRGEIYNSAEKLKALFKPCFVGLTHEELRVACFNCNLELISNVMISRGSPTTAAVEMRTLIETVLKYNSASIAVAHNHPGADPTPSNEDIRFTRLLTSTVNAISIEMLDHIIVGESEVTSMREIARISFWD